MAGKEVILTYEGLKELEDELEMLKGSRRREVAEKIKAALAFGDISENNEYDEAKNEQAQLEIRIAKLDTMLKNAQIIDEDEVRTDKVGIGCKVRISDIAAKKDMEYTIVGSTEADPGKAKISNESPVGKALIGTRKGDIIEVMVPDGLLKFKVLHIDK
ncbi:MAG: transcription elongation factor GreA [Eubacteriales bacterium]|nr:transcription elongation factor GreA [Eubacteriales bacterium]